MSTQKTERAALLALLALLLLAAVLGSAALRFGFVYDDLEFVVRNPRVHTLGEALRTFGEDVWAFDPTKTGGHYYRPLLVLWVATGYQLSGGSPLALHAMSLGLHLGAITLVFRLGKALGLDVRAALLAAAIFALHPIQLQATTWISAANDPLLCVLLLGSLLTWVARGRSLPRAALALLLFAAATLVNERAVLFAGVPALWHFMIDKSGTTRSAFAGAGTTRSAFAGAGTTLAIWIAPVLGLVLVRSLVLGRASGGMNLRVARTLASLPSVVARYARNVAWPRELSLAYPETLKPGDAPSVALGVVVLIIALAAIAFAFRTRGPRAFGVVAAALLLAAPLQVGLLPGFAVVQDRYLYLPFTFVAVVVADACFSRGPVRAPRVALVLAWLFAVALLGPSNQAIWRDEIALYERTVAIAPDNAHFVMNLANARTRAGQDDLRCELLMRARDAMARAPESADPPLVHYNLGNCLRRHGDAGGAVAAYDAAIAAARGTFTAALGNRALTFMESGQLEAAELAAERLTKGAPRDGDAWKLAGVIAARRGAFSDAVQRFELAQKLAPRDASIGPMLAQARRAHTR